MLFRSYKQTATYWAPGTPDGYGGVAYGAPTTLAVRWEEKAEKVVGPQGQDIVSRAIVHVKEDVANGGYLYLGTSIATNPSSVRDAWPVRAFIKIPNLTRPDQYDRRAVL